MKKNGRSGYGPTRAAQLVRHNLWKGTQSIANVAGFRIQTLDAMKLAKQSPSGGNTSSRITRLSLSRTVATCRKHLLKTSTRYP